MPQYDIRHSGEPEVNYHPASEAQACESPALSLKLYPNGNQGSCPYPDAEIYTVGTGSEAAKLIRGLYSAANKFANEAGQAAKNSTQSANAAYVAHKTAQARTALAEAQRLENMAAELAKKADTAARSGDVALASDLSIRAYNTATAAEAQASIAKLATQEIANFLPKK